MKIRNKLTGEIVEIPDAPGARPVGPSDPKIPGQMDSTAASTARTRQQTDIANQLLPYQLRKTKAEAEAAEAKLKKDKAATALTPDKLKGVRADAVNKILLARQLQDRSKNDWFATGFLAPTMSGFGGTNARGVQAGADTLKAGGALAEILKLSAATGKNPFTPMSNSDVELIARNTANLDIGQPDVDFQSAAKQYEDAYTRGFQGAGGNMDELRRYLAKRLGGSGGKSQPKPQGDVEFLGFED